MSIRSSRSGPSSSGDAVLTAAGFPAGLKCAADVELVAWLRGLPFTPGVDAEYANGHARATGGGVTVEDFERFLTALGFGEA